jgi:HPt (histidine-containing phosphotransfer) domain-containing protein
MDDIVSKPIVVAEVCSMLRRWLPPGLVRDKTALAVAPAPIGEEPPEIEGLDAREGIRILGSKELFISTLGDFYKLIDMKATKIEKCLADGMIRDVTVEVHVLKNTARMIGAQALSEEFSQMETYGNGDNAEALERELPAVLAHYRSYKPILRPYGEASEEGKREASKKELVGLLEDIKAAIDGFDLDRADAAHKKLEELRLPAECREQMEALRAYMADVAMEDVIRLAGEMIETINAL